MKRLKKISFSEIGDHYNVLDSVKLANIMGGATDCYFECLAYISNQLGCGSEKKDYQNDYASQYNKHDSVYGPSKYTQAGSFFESNFSTFGSWGSCKTGEFGDYIDDALAASAQVMATFESGYSNNDHAVIIQKALDGDTYKYYDPQKDTFGSIAASKIKFAIGATDCK